jgi:hypothetical protein
MAAGIASGAQVFQIRWADQSKLFVLKKLKVQVSEAMVRQCRAALK